MLKTINGGIGPTKGSKYSACVDLYANEDVTIGAGETKIIPLGVCLDEDNFPIYVTNNKHKLYLQLEPRSSLRVKGLIADTGIIDIDFVNKEIGIIVHNPLSVLSANYDYYGEIKTLEFNKPYYVKKGDRIAQIMLCEHKTSLLGIESEEERQGGYGSTGNN